MNCYSKKLSGGIIDNYIYELLSFISIIIDEYLHLLELFIINS